MFKNFWLFFFLPGTSVPSKTFLVNRQVALMQALMINPIFMIWASLSICICTSNRPLIDSVSDEGKTDELGNMEELRIAPGIIARKIKPDYITYVLNLSLPNIIIVLSSIICKSWIEVLVCRLLNLISWPVSGRPNRIPKLRLIRFSIL